MLIVNTYRFELINSHADIFGVSSGVNDSLDNYYPIGSIWAGFKGGLNTLVFNTALLLLLLLINTDEDYFYVSFSKLCLFSFFTLLVSLPLLSYGAASSNSYFLRFFFYLFFFYIFTLSILSYSMILSLFVFFDDDISIARFILT